MLSKTFYDKAAGHCYDTLADLFNKDTGDIVCDAEAFANLYGKMYAMAAIIQKFHNPNCGITAEDEYMNLANKVFNEVRLNGGIVPEFIDMPEVKL